MEFEKFPKVSRLNRGLIITEKIDGTNAQIAIDTRPPYVSEPSGPAPVATVVTNDGLIEVAYDFYAGSRNRWLAEGSDNHGFAAWVRYNAKSLVGLGPGRHYGEWWGQGIQRGYDLEERRFSLFNVIRWHHPTWQEYKWVPWKRVEEESVSKSRRKRLDRQEPVFQARPECCQTVPVLSYTGTFRDVHHSSPDYETVPWVELYRLERMGSVAAPGYMKPEGIMAFHTASHHIYKVTFENDNAGKDWGA